jgi:hypothetical protein
MAEHEKDFRDEREKTIRRLRELAVESAPAEKARGEEDAVMVDDDEVKREEIEEPAREEQVGDEEVFIEDERPPSLLNLLKDQALYEENPALALFERPPVLPSGQPLDLPDAPPGSRDEMSEELRDSLEDAPDKPGTGGTEKTQPGVLLDYPGNLSDYLPERDTQRFRGSTERLAVESLKAQRAGKMGLRRKVSAGFPAGAPPRKEPVTRSMAVATFSYLKDLSAWHPDKTIGAVMKERIEALVARMGRAG